MEGEIKPVGEGMRKKEKDWDADEEEKFVTGKHWGMRKKAF